MNDVRQWIFGAILGLFACVGLMLSVAYISACGFTLICTRGAPLVVRTPIPTLIPVEHSQAQPAATTVDGFNKCKVAATDLIGAWVSAGHTETEPFPFTDLNGQNCEGTFADIQPILVENSIWFPGSLGCTSCHNADLTDRSAGLDLSSYEAISLGTRRVAEATSPGTDIFGDGNWEDSLLHEVLVNQGLTTQGHSPDVEPPQTILYAGQVVVEAEATEAPAAEAEATPTLDATATPTP
jgi:hypothetical protein